MNKESIRLYLDWLEDATNEELNERARKIEEAFSEVLSPEGRSDLRLARRLLDEERLARLQLLHQK